MGTKNGSGDSAPLEAIIGYLRGTHGIPADMIRKEHYLVMDPATGRVAGLFDALGRDVMGRSIIHRPDIAILGRPRGRIALIIELDGRVHEQYKHERRRTASRNAHYRLARIPYFVINTQRLRDSKKSWFEHIDACIEPYKPAAAGDMPGAPAAGDGHR